MNHRRRPIRPPSGDPPGSVVNLRDLKILPIEDTEIQVIEWCAGDNAILPPSQVHVLIQLPGPEKMGFAILLKTRAAADRFIAALREHTNAVWPIS